LEFDDIERILELMQQHDLSEFELEREGLKLRVRKTSTGYAPLVAPVQTTSIPQAAAPGVPPGPGPSAPAGLPLPSVPAPIDEPALDLAVVKSPIVGTFYRSSEPGAASFVEVGDMVKKDQVLCIIEAMKLMNEITSEYEGELTSAYVENGKPVQYGERLFAIKTS
jgi:acetyl-CoA carboxylase biotin carboxyl carrier protein